MEQIFNNNNNKNRFFNINTEYYGKTSGITK